MSAGVVPRIEKKGSRAVDNLTYMRAPRWTDVASLNHFSVRIFGLKLIVAVSAALPFFATPTVTSVPALAAFPLIVASVAHVGTRIFNVTSTVPFMFVSVTFASSPNGYSVSTSIEAPSVATSALSGA